MAWYSVFSTFYDGALERLYEPHRRIAFQRLPSFGRGLLVPCGTGQDIPFLLPHLAEGGELVGVDLSPGMLGRARQRVAKSGWEGIELLEGDATRLGELVGDSPFDLVVCSLGLTVVPDHNAVCDAAFSLLRPGGTMAIFDAWADKRTFATRQVELMARADLNRKVWEPLEAVASDFQLEFLEDASPGVFGGRLFIATGRRPNS